MGLLAAGFVGALLWLRPSARQERLAPFSYLRHDPTPERIAQALRFESDPGIKVELAEEFRGELAKLQDVARAHLVAIHVARPGGLDPLLAPLLARTDNEVAFVAPEAVVDRAAFAAVTAQESSAIATVAEYGKSLTYQAACGNGIDEAFQEAVGSQVIYVSYEKVAPPLPHIEAKYSVGPGAGRFAAKNGRRIYPAVHITGSLDLVTASGTLATIAMDDEPPADIKFSTSSFSAAFEGGQDDDVAYALVQATCKRAGYRLVDKLIGWKPAAAPTEPREDGEASGAALVSACEAAPTSKDCLLAGRALARGEAGLPVDRKRAFAMFDKGCAADGMEAGEACDELGLLAADDATKLTGMAAIDLLATARARTDMACSRDQPAACARRGYLSLEPGEDHKPPSAYSTREAFDYLVRACMLKRPDACERASELASAPGLAEMPLWGAAAPLMARAAVWWPGTSGRRVERLEALAEGKDSAKVKIRDTVLGRDRIFDVTWADWLDLDPGHAVYMIASKDDETTVRTRLAAELASGGARIYEPTALPYDVRHPGDAKTVKTVYALMATTPTRMMTTERPACKECSGAGNSRFYVGGCTCLPIDRAPPPSLKTR